MDCTQKVRSENVDRVSYRVLCKIEQGVQNIKIASKSVYGCALKRHLCIWNMMPYGDRKSKYEGVKVVMDLRVGTLCTPQAGE